ncbi:ABC transporter permease [Streptomyces bluensis]|uniref:ABC transporter permease n=1 Tax=Streptomyces bluensis TaxID=33897 RepID=UPI00167B7C36|nr:ABC transporter permease [Streptomyces bluensis]GGZ52439.1 sulfate ABC transporter permease [Streptomyces bluensis]
MGAGETVEKNPGAVADTGGETAAVEAGLDALESPPRAAGRLPLGRVLREKALPPLAAAVLILLLWQGACAAHLKPDYLLPSPADVWRALSDQWYEGTLLSTVWNSVRRGALGFAVAVGLGTALGLLLSAMRTLRVAIGPVLSGLQSLPSVAWVPAAIVWFGLTDATLYAVVLLGAVPSVANGLLSGVDQVPPLYVRAGRTLGATGVSGVRHVLLPAALPGFLAGLKQGWAFSWRSLMAAELIASSPELGLGLGQLLESARSYQDMALVLASIAEILTVGVAVDLLLFAPVERRVLRSRGLAGARR